MTVVEPFHFPIRWGTGGEDNTWRAHSCQTRASPLADTDVSIIISRWNHSKESSEDKSFIYTWGGGERPGTLCGPNNWIGWSFASENNLILIVNNTGAKLKFILFFIIVFHDPKYSEVLISFTVSQQNKSAWLWGYNVAFSGLRKSFLKTMAFGSGDTLVWAAGAVWESFQGA